MGSRGLLERRIVLTLAVGAGSEGLPRDPRPRRLLTELPADGDGDRTRDRTEVDADALAECRHLHDRHAVTVDDEGTVSG